MPIRLTVAPLLVFCLFASASPGGALPSKARRPDRAAKPAKVTDDMRAAARSANAFAFDLYARLEDRDGDLFFAPANLSTALAMTAAGAGGETERQILALLHADLPGERFHVACGMLGALSDAPSKEFRLSTANRLWAAKDCPVRPDYLKLVAKRYGAEPVRIDFTQAEQARGTINGWVGRQTNGRVAELFPPGSPAEDTRLLLTSAAYFKGDWAEKFRAKDTKDGPFRLADGGEVTVPLMRQTHRFRYGEADGLQLIELPYAGGALAMTLLLPREVGLARLEERLNAENLDAWLAGTEDRADREVEVVLPRFRTDARFDLAETLSAMGMPSAFSAEADFSDMSPEPLALSDVTHAASVEVSERGTEAAAATGSGFFGGPPVVPFHADRPFLFLIRDLRTGAILFLGRVVDPTK